MGIHDNLLKLKEQALKKGKLAVVTPRELANRIYHSVGIEGSTITEGDTLKIITNNLMKHDYSNREVGEVQDLYDATKYMSEHLGSTDLDEDFILELHAIATKSDSTINSGSYKLGNNYTMHNGVKKNYADASDVEDYIYDIIDIYNNSDRTLEDASSFLIEFINIHPFGDGNGRVHRLLIDWFVLTQGYPPIEITKEDKEDYIYYLHEFNVEGFEKFLASKIVEKYEDMERYAAVSKRVEELFGVVTDDAIEYIRNGYKSYYCNVKEYEATSTETEVIEDLVQYMTSISAEKRWNERNSDKVE